MAQQPGPQQNRGVAQPAAQILPMDLTSDVVASILGTIFGIFLGGILLLIFMFINPAADLTLFFAMVAVTFGTAYGFAKLCYHMDLTGHRFFRQAYSLIIPATLILFTGLSIMGAIAVKFQMLQAGDAGAHAGAAFRTPLDMVEIILWTIAVALLVLIPFGLHARKEERMHPSELLPLIVPILLCVLSWWLVPKIIF